MAAQFESTLHDQLMDRRRKLESAIAVSPERASLNSLLLEVDAALSRMNDGSFGLCDVCHEPIESDRLAANPLLRFCLDHLADSQRRALEQDLELASRIQSALLPRPDFAYGGWQAAFHYEPLSVVSGDYCDLISAEDGSMYFMIGDVSGKGVAASMLMAHLNAMMRALAGLGLPLVQIMERASRVFCESTLASHFATLVCGRAERNGMVEICNAGHSPTLLAQGDTVRTYNATSLPLGLFCNEEFSTEWLQLQRGDLLLLYTDGVSEARNSKGEEYGDSDIIETVRTRSWKSARELVHSCISKVADFRAGTPPEDDLTLMAIQRIE